MSEIDISNEAVKAFLAQHSWIRDDPSVAPTRREFAHMFDMLTALSAKVEAMAERLEINHHYVAGSDGKMVRVDRPYAEWMPESFDGIACRDLTIKGQDESIDELVKERDALAAKVERLTSVANSLCEAAMEAAYSIERPMGEIADTQRAVDAMRQAIAAARGEK